MKVVQINAVYGEGSTGRTVKELHEYLLKHGHESWVFVGSGDSSFESLSHSGDDGVIQIGSRFEAKAHALESRLTGWQAHGSRLGTKRLINHLVHIEPSVVVVRNVHANYVNIVYLLSWLAENAIPTVLCLDDCWFYTGKCTHYTSIGCEGWQNSCGRCPKLNDDIPSLFFDRTKEMLEEKRLLFKENKKLGVIGVSDWVLKESQKGILNCASHRKRIYNWIDLDLFRPVDSIVRDDLQVKDKMILCVSSGWKCGTKKHINLEAISHTIKRNETLVVVGDMEDGVLPDGCVHIPSISDVSVLAEFYSSADLYLHLGEEDTFGKVIAEALACGTPVVTFDSTAYPELVSCGCGKTVPTGDIAEMRKAMDAILYKGGADRYLCREFALSNFDKTTLIGDFIDFLLEVIGC